MMMTHAAQKVKQPGLMACCGAGYLGLLLPLLLAAEEGEA